jgi:hypothetical protein
VNELTTLLNTTTATPVRRPTKHEDIIPEFRIHSNCSEEEEEEEEGSSSCSSTPLFWLLSGGRENLRLDRRRPFVIVKLIGGG